MQYRLKKLLPNKFIEMSWGHSIRHQTIVHSLILFGLVPFFGSLSTMWREMIVMFLITRENGCSLRWMFIAWGLYINNLCSGKKDKEDKRWFMKPAGRNVGFQIYVWFVRYGFSQDKVACNFCEFLSCSKKAVSVRKFISKGLVACRHS